VTRDVFRSFLIDFLARPSLFDRSTTFTLVLDNAAIHKGDIEDTIFQVGHACTALNPIEYAFSKWKLAYRVHHAGSEAAVHDAIKQAASSITPQDCMH
jgi:transposase